ncbi:MAG: hypothetical protein ACMUIA_01115 [bacterium]
MYRVLCLIGLSLCLTGMLLVNGRISQADILVNYQKDGIQLSWAKPVQRINGDKLLPSEIAGYNIYRSTDEKGNYKIINHQSVKDVQYLDRTIEWGTCYYYTLTTIDHHGLEGPRSKTVAAIPPLSPPQKVKALGRRQKVTLTWNKSNNPEIRGYNIYRSELPGQGYQRVTSVLDLEHEYQDTEVTVGKNYYYVLTTVDVSWQESAWSEEAAATPVWITQDELSALERIDGFQAAVENGAVMLHWEPVPAKDLAGYTLYRRPGEGSGLSGYQKVHDRLIVETSFRDEQVEPQKSYYYCLAAVDKEGNEAQFPKEIYITVADLYINSLAEDSGGCPLRGGRSLAITMVGTPDQRATASLGGLIEGIVLNETDHQGIYFGECIIPEDIDGSHISVIGRLRNEEGEEVEFRLPDRITIDNHPPLGISSISAELTPEMVCLGWKLSQPLDDIAYIEIYRSSGECKIETGELIKGNIKPQECSFCDRSILPGQRFFYSLLTYDRAGNRTASPHCFSVDTPADSLPPQIHTVRELSPPGTKRTGDTISIQVIGEPKAEGRFSIGPKISHVLKETEPGQYRGEYTVQPGDDLESEPVSVELRDASGNQAIWQGDLTISIHTQGNSTEPPDIRLVEHNAFQMAGFSPLVAGDKLGLSVWGDPGCTAYVDLGALVSRSGPQTSLGLDWDRNLITAKFGPDIRSYHIYRQETPYANVQGLTPIEDLSPAATFCTIESYGESYIALTAEMDSGEQHMFLTPRLQIPLSEGEPGHYEGIYEVKPGDYLWDGPVTAWLVNDQGVQSPPASAGNLVTIDTSVEIAVIPQEKCLRADSRARTEVYLEVKDARGIGLPDRELVLDVFTTFDEYSGIVGVGYFDHDKYGYVDQPNRLQTDPWGKIVAPYVAGFAAKTVIIRGTDMASRCVGLGYITSYIEGEITIELLEPPGRQRFSQPELSLILWSDKGWLTADGVSRTHIHAQVLNGSGHPVPGHLISFLLTSGEGRLEGIQNTTDQNGTATALYIAGRSISPPVEITAIDKTAGGLSQVLGITLKSDAPAQIAVNLEGDAQLPIYADGTSTLNLIVHVEDINGNPNRHIPLLAEIVKGEGNLIHVDNRTDFNGDYRLKYRAGMKPGPVTIRTRAISRIPDPEVLDNIRISESTL